MRKSKIISFLSVSLLILGTAMIALRATGAVHLRWLINDRDFIGVGALVAAGVGGVIASIRMRQGLRGLEAKLRALRGMQRIVALDAHRTEFGSLIEAMNGVMELAEDAVKRAASEVQQANIQLRVAMAERQHAEAILHSISDAVLVTDAYDELVLANDSAGRTFDFSIEPERRPVDVLVRDERVVGLIREMRQRKMGRQVVEHSMKTPSGGRIYKLTCSCVADRQGQPTGVVTVLHDITRERELAQMKNDFVSHVSHELRTPLASIKAYAEMLIDGEATEEKTQHEFYEVIHNEAYRLERLIDNILNISRIESGLVKVTKKPQSLMVLAKEAMEVIEPQAMQKQISLEGQLTPALYQTLGDRDMLYQAVLNLLGNAVKYTPDGGRVAVETAVDEAKKKVILRIRDNGVGIPPKDLPYVFDKFYRSDANSRMAKGTGLGLSLVKHIVETVHHGRVFAESEVGKGSTFGFELDLLE